MLTWRAAGGVVTVAALTAGLWAQGGSAPSFSALDYYQIKQLHARFSHGFDTAADNGNLMAGVFTDDGVLKDEAGKTIEGRINLAQYARSNPLATPTNVSHYVTNVVVDAVPGGAVGRSDVMVGRREAGNPRGAFSLGGEYVDVFVRTAAGWRIRSREFCKVGASVTPPTVPATASVASATSSASGLTAADYAEIEQLYARYSHGFDSAADRGRMWAQLFASDGSHRNFPNQYIRGHEALAEFAYDERGNQAETKTPMSALHFITNVMIDRVPDGIVAKAYLMYVRRGGDAQPTTVYPGGTYWDLIVKTPQGWRYKEKNVIMANLPVPEPARKLASPVATDTARVGGQR